MIFLTEKNTLKAYGTIYDGDGLEFVYQYERLAKVYDEVIVRLHTYGGSVFDGNLIFNILNATKPKLIIDGVAASMGGILLTAVDDVSIVENGFIMLHAPSSGGRGNAKDHESAAKLLRMMQRNFVEKLMAKTNLPLNQVEKFLDGDNWFSAQEAKEIGLVKHVIPARITPAMPVENPGEMGEQQMYNAYAQLLTNTESEKFYNQNSNNTEMKQMIIAAFQLNSVSADSSDTAVLNALKDVFAEKQNELNESNQARVNAENSLQEFKEEQVKAFVEAYAKENKVSDEKKEALINIGKTSGLEALAQVIDTAPKNQAPGISGMIKNAGNTSVDSAKASWTWDDWQQKDPRGLEALAVNDKDAYNELLNNKFRK